MYFSMAVLIGELYQIGARDDKTIDYLFAVDRPREPV